MFRFPLRFGEIKQRKTSSAPVRTLGHLINHSMVATGNHIDYGFAARSTTPKGKADLPNKLQYAGCIFYRYSEGRDILQSISKTELILANI